MRTMYRPLMIALLALMTTTQARAEHRTSREEVRKMIMRRFRILLMTVMALGLCIGPGSASDVGGNARAAQVREATYYVYYCLAPARYWSTAGPYAEAQACAVAEGLNRQGYEVRFGDGSGPPSPPNPDSLSASVGALVK